MSVPTSRSCFYVTLFLTLVGAALVGCGDDDDHDDGITQMEGDSYRISNGRRQWNYVSIPRDSTATSAADPVLNYRDRFRRIEWYNPEERVRSSDLDPTLEGTEGDQFITVLEIALKRGSFNDSTGSANAWGGIMRLLSKSGVDFSLREFIEIWINGPEEGLLHIDLGVLSEDAMWQDGVAPNGGLDTEDRDGDGYLDNTGTGDPLTDEDTGLDTLFNDQEPPCVTAGCDPSDPTGDDWDYDEDDKDKYSRINKTENNGVLDTEDLDTNGYLTRPDDELYFRYTVNLSPAIRPPEAVGAQGTRWRLYRIPLQDEAEGERPIGNPSLENDIKMARIWFTGFSRPDPAPFQIASIEIVGDTLQQDSTRVVPGYHRPM